MRSEQRNRVDLEAVRWMGRDIGRRQYGVDPQPCRVAQQESAAFVTACGLCLALDRLGESP
jgi:hypothetical protein